MSQTEASEKTDTSGQMDYRSIVKQLLEGLLATVIAGLFYYIFNFVVAFGMEKLEKKLDYYR